MSHIFTVNTGDRMIEATFKGNYFRITSNRISLQDVSHLFKVGIFIFPKEHERNTLKSIDKREEKLMNEVVMVNRIEIVESCHQIDQDLTKLILAIGSYASILEKVEEKFHCLALVFNENACLAF
mgnify:CR=1 FL=1